MGTESVYERTNAILATIIFKDTAGTATDPSGSTAFLRVIKPDGTNLIGSTSGSTAGRTGTGAFSYYFNTESTSPLGLYILQWHGYNEVGVVGGIDWGYKRITERDVIRIVDTSQ